MLNVYLSARFSRAADCERAAAQIRAAGHEVTSRWHRPDSDHRTPATEYGAGADEFRARCAREDLEDLQASDVLIFFNETQDSEGRRGGRHVEFGLAYAAGQLCVILGKPSNVFHYLPGVPIVDSLPAAIEILNGLAIANPKQDEPITALNVRADLLDQ